MDEKQKILIVDDKKENLVVLRRVLGELNAELVEATSGNEALSVSLHEHFALAILDVMMPGMDGYELAELLRGDDDTRVIPIIFVTASYTDEIHMFKGYDAGGIDYIVKPFDPQVLIGKVKVFLELDRYREELRRHRDHLEGLVEGRTSDLQKRVKEIKCIYTISSLASDSPRSLESVLEAAVDLIAPGMQYPDIACVRIGFEGREYKTANFRETPWRLVAPIRLETGRTDPPGGQPFIDVRYLEQRPDRDEGPFLKEESSLIDEIANRLGVMIEGKRAEERERHLAAVLRSIRNINQLIVHENRRDRLIRKACENMVSARGFQGAWIVLAGRFPAAVEYASAGFEKELVERLARMFQTGCLPACCQGERINRGVVVTENMVTACNGCPLAERYGGNSAITMKLSFRDQVCGWMGVSFSAKFSLDPEEASLLTETAGDIAFALNRMDMVAERKRSQDTLEAIFRSAGDGILLADVETGCFVEANDAVCRMLGYTGEELQRLSVADIHPAESLEHVLSQFERQKRGEIMLASDIPLKRKDGSIFYTDVNSGRFDLEGRQCLVGFFRDITERKKAEAYLRESEKRFRTLFEGSTEGILVTDVESRTNKYVNPAICRMLNYSMEELLQLKLDDLHPKDVMPEVEASIGGHRRGELKPAHGLPCLRKDGTRIFADIRSTRINIDGQPCLLAFFSDVTEQMRLETEKKALELQLQQAQKMEALGQLAGGVAHDYNNMIGIILGYGELVLNKMADDDPLRSNIEEIVNAAMRSKDITLQLLAFARQQRVNPRVLDMNEAVDGMLKMLKRMLGESIKLAWQPGLDLWPVCLDPSQLVQILTNLCSNAHDAIGDVGKVTIGLENKILDGTYQDRGEEFVPGEYVMLYGRDSGSGMNRQVMKKIFDPFFTTKEMGKGTGLGLSTVYGIIKQNRGVIDVQSGVGKGTTFNIYLPRYTGTDAGRIDEENAYIPKSNGETVLVVEDEEQYLELIETILSRLGYKVLTATTPKEAIRLAGKQTDDITLLITDVVMPEMNGKELGEHLRDVSCPGLKVLYISGYSSDNIVARGIKSESRYLLRKPFLLSDLAARVNSVLSDTEEEEPEKVD